jgi:molybdopterin-guanine dinucleotide biosynthesis protein B
VLVASPFRYAIFHELHGAEELGLAEQRARLAPADLTLVEGFKQADIPKLEVYRPALGLAPLYPERQDVLALASDAPMRCGLPWLNLDDAAAVGVFILANAAG